MALGSSLWRYHIHDKKKNIHSLLPVCDRSTGGGKVKSGSIDEQKAQACATSDRLKSLARLCEFERPNLAIHSRRVGFCRGRDEPNIPERVAHKYADLTSPCYYLTWQS